MQDGVERASLVLMKTSFSKYGEKDQCIINFDFQSYVRPISLSGPNYFKKDWAFSSYSGIFYARSKTTVLPLTKVSYIYKLQLLDVFYYLYR